MFSDHIGFLLEYCVPTELRRPEFRRELEKLLSAPCTVGFLGMQSVGKTTLINACLEFPLFPTCKTVGTACPVLIERGDPAIWVYAEGANRLEEVAVQPQDDALFTELEEYACYCVRESVIALENLEYFIEETTGKEELSSRALRLNPSDTRHFLLLVLILLTVYVGQNKEAAPTSSPLLKRRERLLKKLGIPQGQFHSIKVIWDSALLENGIRLMDLPGLGSFVAGDPASGRRSHDETATRYARDCDVILCMTSGEAMGGFIRPAIEKILENASPNKRLHFLTVVNKADHVVSPAVTCHAARGMFEQLSATILYFISAAAGEYRYIAKGIPIDRTQFWKYEFIQMLEDLNEFCQTELTDTADMAEKTLRKRYTKEFPCYSPSGEPFPMDLESFIETVISQHCADFCREKLKAVFALAPQAASALIDATDTRFRLLNGGEEICNSLCDYLLGLARQTLQAYEKELKCVAEGLKSAEDCFAAEFEGFLSDCQEAFSGMNEEFCGKLITLISESKEIFGRVFVASVSKGGGDDRALRINYRMIDSAHKVLFDFDYEGCFSGAFAKYDNAVRQINGAYEEYATALRNSYECFGQGIRILPQKAKDFAGQMGVDDLAYGTYLDHDVKNMCILLQNKMMEIRHPSLYTFAEMPELPKIPWVQLADKQLKDILGAAQIFGSAELMRNDFNGTGLAVFHKPALLQELRKPFFRSNPIHAATESVLEPCVREIQVRLDECFHICRKAAAHAQLVSDIWLREFPDMNLFRSGMGKMEEHLAVLSFFNTHLLPKDFSESETVLSLTP